VGRNLYEAAGECQAAGKLGGCWVDQTIEGARACGHFGWKGFMGLGRWGA
jgi:hypothetical protein